ncbi:M15 family metallopeptidase [Aquirufa antheringensis]|uniref:M15 family metallopeptidase n=1 Tax=Aquirufa antheringensis TaxID=2516559 RepID=UPI0022A8BA82|nr:M15 family metallopeptidase [Aquirufa antheringensis]
MKNLFAKAVLMLLISLSVKAQKTTCAAELSMQKQGLQEVTSHVPGVLVELKYATTDNFMKKDVYGCLTHAYLQKETVAMLKKAQENLEKAHPGYHLLIYDAARPLSKQWELWNTLTEYSPEKRRTYVADPKEHSIHNYGSAIDLTVADETGKPLEMGTKYDFFGEMAYPKEEARLLKAGKLSQKAIDNRLILRKAMKSAGFMPIEYEWWHFNAFSRKVAKEKFSVIP